MPTGFPDDLVDVLHAVRTRTDVSQPELVRLCGSSRSIVAARVAELRELGLLGEAGLGPSTGGRAPRRLRLRAEAGVVVGVDAGASGMRLAVADLAGRVLERSEVDIDVADGPELVLGRVEAGVEELLTGRDTPVWGLGIGLPGPVDVAAGLPVAPPIMPGWDRYPVRARLAERFGVPVWVDNDVNLLALGELRADPTAAGQDLICVKVGTGIGAGLVSNGRVHRGANGGAGDIGHIAVTDTHVVCRCGNVGCLEAVAGGAALARDAREIARSGRSEVLAARLDAHGSLSHADVTVAAEHGDPAARALLAEAGRVIGATLATLVSFYNPARVVLSGGVVAAGDHVLAAVREAVYRRSLPLATRTLRIEPSALGATGGTVGAVHLALDGVFSGDELSRRFGGEPALAN
ncbi:ROK family protein [Actinomycetospora termitidis]|uniref:ROK family protein n=1 Tax=Actinomycetospora termitidis TaxID=3053470 RepID=A0ABT7M6T3_9PSEU|nr:ROK family protein [Actinomycetospora sp. Odt1-22]MDL5156350.1 ROK family protein [Actinomycetospora sp. Odt1-22]